MRYAWRAVLLVVVFAGVGLLTTRGVLSHAAVHSGPSLPEVRLAAMMAGLFAGGATAVVVGIGLAVRGSKDKRGGR